MCDTQIDSRNNAIANIATSVCFCFNILAIWTKIFKSYRYWQHLWFCYCDNRNFKRTLIVVKDECHDPSWQYLKSIQLINKSIHFMSDGIDFDMDTYIRLMTFILNASLDWECPMTQVKTISTGCVWKVLPSFLFPIERNCLVINLHLKRWEGRVLWWGHLQNDNMAWLWWRKGTQICAAGKMPQHVSMLCSFVACGQWCVDKEWEPIQETLLSSRGPELNMICTQCFRLTATLEKK